MTLEQAMHLKAGDRVCWIGEPKNIGTVMAPVTTYALEYTGKRIKWDDDDDHCVGWWLPVDSNPNYWKKIQLLLTHPCG